MVGSLYGVKHAGGRGRQFLEAVLIQMVNSIVKACSKYCLIQRIVMLKIL